MNKNEFDVFEDPDDEIINEIAANYPVLTDKEKEALYEVLNNININTKTKNIKLEIDFNPVRL